MKNLCLLYNKLTNDYIINEEGKTTADNTPDFNIKKSLDEVLDFFVDRYGKRNITIITDPALPSLDYETLEFFVKEKLSKAKIEKGE